MKSFIFSLLLIPIFGISQSGPGGVGNTTSNGLWLRADKIDQADNTAVSSWSDNSGNSNDGGQTNTGLQPTFQSTSSLNGLPVVRFDGSNDQILIQDADILDGSSGLTYYSVIRPSNLNGSPRGILGKRTTFNVTANYAYTWYFHTANRIYNDINTNNDRYSTAPTTYSNANNYILSFDFNGTLPSAQRARMYENGDVTVVAGETSTSVINSNEEVVLGALNENYGTYLGADYGEVIQFNFSLDSLEHVIISNYLSSKYDISIGSHDLYRQDLVLQGNYDYDVAALGQIDATMRQDDAQGCSILRISNPSNLDDDEYLFWGHNNEAQVATNTSDVPASLDARFERVWRVNEIDGLRFPVDVGTVDMRWDLSDLGPVTTGDLRLLVDTDNDGIFADETPISGAVSVGGGIYQFAGVSAIANDLRFTLGTINSIQTALPVEYLSLEGRSFGKANVISWETLSEIDNDFFTLESSDDSRSWGILAKVGSKGERGGFGYKYVDEGIIADQYYRLKQTDKNGRFSYSKVIFIGNKVTLGNLVVSPNPASDYISFNQEISQIIVFDINGKDITSATTKSGKKALDISRLANGLYFIKLSGSQVVSFVKM